MIFHSDLPKKAYLAAMKSNMSGHLELGVERFTGFFIGNCFYVTHHAGYQWNQKITNQKNTAIGFVKDAPADEGGCDIHFFQCKGLLCPFVFLPTFLVILFAELLTYGTVEPFTSETFWTCFTILLIVMAIFAPIYTLMEASTDGSIQGEKMLLFLLSNPTDPYGGINL